MAMGKCKECGNEVSTKAEACPKCGAVLKEKTGCLGYVGAIMGLWLLINVLPIIIIIIWRVLVRG